MKAHRRSILKRLFTTLTSTAGAGAFSAALADNEPEKNTPNTDTGVSGMDVSGTDVPSTDVPSTDVPSTDVPLYSGSTRLGNMIFVSGAGAHFEGDIKAHTDHVLKEIEKELIKAGSSMDKVLKVNVLLHDLNDYKAMNEVYQGRFGNKPPVRTTVSTHAGVPGDSLVEIDCIAYV
ncbi:RidA family protein [Spirosoma lituiforme]